MIKNHQAKLERSFRADELYDSLKLKITERLMLLNRTFTTKFLLSFSLLLLPYSNSWAQEKDLPKPSSSEVSEAEETQYRTPAVEVIGSERNLELIPGSGTVLGEDRSS